MHANGGNEYHDGVLHGRADNGPFVHHASGETATHTKPPHWTDMDCSVGVIGDYSLGAIAGDDGQAARRLRLRRTDRVGLRGGGNCWLWGKRFQYRTSH